MTQKLYEADAYCREFTATVLLCEEENGTYRIVLDRTAFFPEGGGQAADSGVLGGVVVRDVQEKDGVITHFTEAPLAVGEAVTGVIDWDVRFSRMQSHAGEHIVSGVVHTEYGYDNVGFHMSADELMTVDFNGTLTAENIEKVELLANQAVYRNLAITASYPTREELGNIPYRSKIEPRDGIRLITIDTVDCCACCAPHPARTGEIGIIKIVNAYPFKQGTRVEMLAGIHALQDYAALNAVNKSLMGTLSAPRHAIKEAVEKQVEQLGALRFENQTMSKKLAFSELKPISVGSAVYAFTEGVSFDELRYCANALSDGGATACALFSKEPDGGYLYVLCSVGGNVRDTVKALNEAFGGKGGGKPEYAQGKLAPCEESAIDDWISKNL